jgi:hypothetical protein
MMALGRKALSSVSIGRVVVCEHLLRRDPARQLARLHAHA